MPPRSHIVSALLCGAYVWPSQAWLLPPEIRRVIAQRNVGRAPEPVFDAALKIIARDDRSDAAEELSEELEDLIDELEVFRADFSAFIASTTTPVASSVSTSVASSTSSSAHSASSSLSPATPPMGNSKSSSIKAVTPNGRINSVAQFNPSINPQATLQDLASLCNNPQIDIITIGYITSIFGPNTHYPSLAFGPGCDTTNTLGQNFDGTKLPNCSALGTQILTCQQAGKRILASLEVQAADMGFSSTDQAQSSAQMLWRILGGDKSANSNIRPLGYGPDGTAITIDGFEYYLNDDAVASSALNDYTRTFFNTLNGYFATESTRSYFLAVSLPESAASFLSAAALQLVAWVTVRINVSEGMQKRSVLFKIFEQIVDWGKQLGHQILSPLPTDGATVAASTTSPTTTTTPSTMMVSSAVSSPPSMTSSGHSTAASAPMTPPQNALFPGNTFYMSSASSYMPPAAAAHSQSPAVASSHSQLESSSSTASSSISSSSATTTSPPEPEESNDEVGSTDPPPDSGTSFSVIDAEETQSSMTSAPTPPPTTTAPPSTTSSDSNTTVVQTVEVTPVPAPPEQSSMRKRQAMQQSGPLLFVQVNVGSSSLVDDVGQTLSAAAAERLIGGVELFATAQEIQGASIFGGVLVPLHHK